ncbi:MAG: hypothetical protein GY805_11215 [Chloroflexi bacterium]|nr:hypothetical protein [Chloroflexota bacterium]
MKTALNPATQQEIDAGPDAPKTAVCPRCKGKVMLRSRRNMDNTRTYFWRHEDHAKCTVRRRAASHSR